MQKQLIKDCKAFLETIHIKEIMKNEEVILWIYWNFFFYLQAQRHQSDYGKDQMLRGFKVLESFHGLREKYEKIPNEVYGLLEKRILAPYAHRLRTGSDINRRTGKNTDLTLKDLEEVYELFLQEELRIKTGAYYTPEPIVEHMVLKTIVPYIDRRVFAEEKILEGYMGGTIDCIPIHQALDILSVLEALKVVDLSCGGGVFLRHALRLIFNIKANLYTLLGRAYTPFHLKKEILEKNIFGMDIQSNTITLCKLLFLLELALTEASESLMSVQWNIGVGNGLQLSQYDYFDIVIGNPPYIGERGNKDLFDQVKQTAFGEKYYESKMDYFYFFIYKSHEVLKKGGVVGYITTNYFVTADGGRKLRKFIKDHFTLTWLVNFNEINIFKSAKGQHNMIMIAEKGREDRGGEICFFHSAKVDLQQIHPLLTEGLSSQVEKINLKNQREFYDSRGHLMIQSKVGRGGIFKKIEERANFCLENLCAVNQGIVSGADRLSLRGATKLKEIREVGEGIFVLHDEELRTKGLDGESYQKYVRKFYKNSHIKRYYTLKNTELNILYIDDNNLKDIEDRPLLHKHFLAYKNLLEDRREVKMGVRKWYALQWPRDVNIFQVPKIVVPQRSLENTFAYVEGPWYASADVYYITPRAKGISLAYLLGILNSSLMYFWLFYRGKKKGEYLELYATPLKAIPIYYPTEEDKRKEIEEWVQAIQATSSEDKIKVQRLQGKIDEAVYKLYGLTIDEEQEIKIFMNKRRQCGS